MRPNRALSLFVALAAVTVAATWALACSDSASTKVSGTFDQTGHFVLTGAWNKDGAPIANAAGMVLDSFTTEKDLAIPASSLAGKQVCLFGELDVAHKTMHVAGYKECGAGACDAGARGCGAKAAAASAGAGCCTAKGAAAASAGHCPAMVAPSASAASAGHCAAAPTAAAASAGHCAAAPTASAAASPGACAGKAPAAAAGSDACCVKGAKASTAAAPSGLTMKAATPDAKENAVATTLVYKVSGMHCGNCASKVQSAVSAFPNVAECSVSVEQGRAVVTTKGDVDRDAIQKAITAAGFPAELAPAAAQS